MAAISWDLVLATVFLHVSFLALYVLLVCLSVAPSFVAYYLICKSQG